MDDASFQAAKKAVSAVVLVNDTAKCGVKMIQEQKAGTSPCAD